MEAAAQEHLFSGSCSDPCVFFPLAAFEGVGENSRLGFGPENHTLHRGIIETNSTNTLGMRGVEIETRGGYRYTGKERDTESNLDNFGARYDASSMGRFMSADPDNAGANDVAPQSWNAYAYVNNQVLNAIDPTGLDCLYFMGSWISVVRGDCISDNDNGYYVDGTVDTSKLSVSLWDKTDQTLDVPLANGQDTTIHFNPSLGPNDPRLSSDPLFDGLLFAGLGGVPSLVRTGASLAGEFFGFGGRAAIEGTAESMTGGVAGDIIGWGKSQAAEDVEKTIQLANNLTQDEVKEMAAKGLTKGKVEKLANQYARAMGNAKKLASNKQLLPRFQLMTKILELWPGK